MTADVGILSSERILEIAHQAADAASEVLIAGRDTHSVSTKSSSRDLVTSVDLEAETAIVETLHRHFPDHSILAEESYNETSEIVDLYGPLWVIDPLDGTNNYASKQLHVASSIAFVHHGKPVVGVVDAPFLKERFSATAGKGAFCNATRICTSQNESLEQAMVATGFPYQREEPLVELILDNLGTVLRNSRDIRRNGAAALDLCWVACGRFDAFYEFTLKPWDIAAGALIAEEAGATVGHIRGHRKHTPLPDALDSENFLVTGSKPLFETLQKTLRARELA